MPSSRSRNTNGKTPSGPSEVYGFGANYYHNMGQAKKKKLQHNPEEEIEVYTFDGSSSAPPWTTENDPVVDVACGASASYFLTANGKIYTCGTMHGKIRPKLTRKIIQLPLKCAQIAAGRHFVLARMEGGLAVCSWGAGHFGQLGLGTDSAPCIEHPTVVEALLPHVVGSPISSVACGYWHAMAATQAGQLYAWGCNRSAQCGMKPQRDPPTICVPNLVKFTPPTNSDGSSSNTQIQITKIAGGRSHSVALDTKGQVYCWGACQYGQCGQVSRRRGVVAPPKHVEALAQVTIQEVAAGDSHTLALTGGGRLFGWGGGFEGQLGIGSIIQLNPKPKLIGDLDFVAVQAQRQVLQGKKVDDLESGITAADLSGIPRICLIYAAGNSSVAISTSGHAYSWGCNDVGSIGIPKPADSDNMIFAEPGIQPVNKISATATTPPRQLHTMSFDSTHNVALPIRIDAFRNLNIIKVAGSPTFTWFLGRMRTPEEENATIIGRTLYEVQEGKRFQILRSSSGGAVITKGGTKLGGKTTTKSASSATKSPSTSAMKKSATKVTTAAATVMTEDLTDNPPDSQSSLMQSFKAPDSQSSIPVDPPEVIEGATERTDDIPTSPYNSSRSLPPRSPITGSAKNDDFSPSQSKSKRRFNLKKLASKMARRASGKSSSSKLDTEAASNIDQAPSSETKDVKD